MTDEEWNVLHKKLATSAFRARFALKGSDKQYVYEKGRDTIMNHARRIITERLAPQTPLNDGRQTPMKGHPVFIAQHATGCCCRNCLYKWHHIDKGKALTDDEIEYIVSIIMHWIDNKMMDFSPEQPLLF